MYRLGPRGRAIRFARSLTTASKPAESTHANHVRSSPCRTIAASIDLGGLRRASTSASGRGGGVVVGQPEPAREVVAGARGDDAERHPGLGDEFSPSETIPSPPTTTSPSVPCSNADWVSRRSSSKFASRSSDTS